MSGLEQALNLYVDSIWKEEKNLAKIKLVAFLLEILKGGKKIATMLVLAVVAFMVFTAAVFAGIVYIVRLYSETGQVPFDPFVGLVSAIVLLSVAAMIWALRDKVWLNAFHIPDIVAGVSTPETKPATPAPTKEIRNET